MILRDYQVNIIEEARAKFRAGDRNVLIQSPTGSGKTVLTAFMMKEAAAKGISSIFLVHRIELLRQSCRALESMGIDHGVICAGSHDDGKLVTVASVQTVSRRINKMNAPGMLIFDEAHHVASKTWSKIFHTFGKSFKIGLTATPRRADGKGLCGWFESMVHGPSVPDLIASGSLSEFKVFAPSSPDLSGVRTLMGDYVQDGLATVMNTPSITGDAVVQYRKAADGRQFIASCVSVEHSKNVCRAFNDAGISCVHVDCKTSKEEREEAVRLFKAKEIRGLSNCDLFSEGLDVPGAEVAILLRPTKSLTLYLQQVGRVMRPHGGTSVILDHAGNCVTHGMPDDDFQWSLDGSAVIGKKKDQSNETYVKVCKNCFAAQRAKGSDKCVQCGEQFEVKQRKIRRVEGDLVEVTASKRSASEKASAVSMTDLTLIGVRRGYKNPRGWAWHVMNGRKRRAENVRDGIAKADSN